MNWLSSQLDAYKPILIGLLIGTGAKYGMSMSEGRKVTFRDVVIDILQMAMLALAAKAAIEQVNLSEGAKLLLCAVFALSGQRVLNLAKTKFNKQLSGVEGAIDGTRGGAVVELGDMPEHSGQPQSITVIRANNAGAAGVEQMAREMQLPHDTAEFNDMLDKLEGEQ